MNLNYEKIEEILLQKIAQLQKECVRWQAVADDLAQENEELKKQASGE